AQQKHAPSPSPAAAVASLPGAPAPTPPPAAAPTALPAAAPAPAPKGLVGALYREPLEPQAASFSHSSYPLHNSFIYDTGADTHVCNNKDRFTALNSLSVPKYLRAGDSTVAIKGYGTIEV